MPPKRHLSLPSGAHHAENSDIARSHAITSSRDQIKRVTEGSLEGGNVIPLPLMIGKLKCKVGEPIGGFTFHGKPVVLMWNSEIGYSLSSSPNEPLTGDLSKSLQSALAALAEKKSKAQKHRMIAKQERAAEGKLARIRPIIPSLISSAYALEKTERKRVLKLVKKGFSTSSKFSPENVTNAIIKIAMFEVEKAIIEFGKTGDSESMSMLTGGLEGLVRRELDKAFLIYFQQHGLNPFSRISASR